MLVTYNFLILIFFYIVIATWNKNICYIILLWVFSTFYIILYFFVNRKLYIKNVNIIVSIHNPLISKHNSLAMEILDHPQYIDHY